jgi:hypothetical protein
VEQFYINLNIAGWSFAGVVAVALMVRSISRRTSRDGHS